MTTEELEHYISQHETWLSSHKTAGSPMHIQSDTSPNFWTEDNRLIFVKRLLPKTHNPAIGNIISALNFKSRKLSECKVTNVNFKQRDHSNADLSNSTLTDNIFDECDLSNTKLKKANLERTIFIRCNFKKTKMTDVKISGSKFSSCDLSSLLTLEGDTNGAKFINCSFSGMKLTQWTVKHCEFIECDFTYCDLSGAFLTENDFENVNFTGALLDYSNLEKSRFTSCILQQVRMEHSLLKSSLWRNCIIHSSSFNATNFESFEAHKAKITDCQFIATNLQGILIAESTLSKCLFHCADLRPLETRKTDGSKIEIIKKSVRFTSSTLDNCDLTGLRIDVDSLLQLPPEVIEEFKDTFNATLPAAPGNQLIIRSLHFPKGYGRVGVSSLGYFETFLKRKYPTLDIAVTIKQTKDKILFIIETPEGNKEEIDLAYLEYTRLISGNITPESISKSEIELFELRSEIRCLKLQLEQKQDSLDLIRTQHEAQSDFMKIVIKSFEQALTPSSIYILNQSTNNLESKVDNFTNIEINIDLDKAWATLLDQITQYSRLASTETSGEGIARALENIVDEGKKFSSPKAQEIRSTLSKIKHYISSISAGINLAKNCLHEMTDIHQKGIQLIKAYNSVAAIIGLPQIPC